MGSLVQSATKQGVLVYTSAKGSETHIAEKHITSFTKLPNNEIHIVSSGDSQRVKLTSKAAHDIAVDILDDALM